MSPGPSTPVATVSGAAPRLHVAEVRPLRVLVVDDDPLARHALQEALSGNIQISVAGVAATGAAAVELATELHPDVVLMDPDLPEIDGITATLRIRRANPDIHVVMLAATEDDELAMLALRAGAAGFMIKDTTAAALQRAVEGVVKGEAVISRALTLRLIERMRRLPDQGIRPGRSALTAREWQVLDLMARGRRTNEIAEDLVLSIETVRSHIKHILAKLGVHSRAQAIKVAEKVREGAGVAAMCESDIEEAAFQRIFHRLREFREAR